LEGRLTPSAFTVNSTGDTGSGSGSSGDLRYCLTQSNGSGGANTIQFDPGVFSTPQTITLASALPAVTDSGLTITGPGSSLATVSGNKAFQVFNISAANASLSGLTIANGGTGYGAGINFSGTGTLTLANLVIANNSTSNSGGGIYSNSSGTLNLTNCVLSGNYAKEGAGALLLASSTTTATFTDCTLSGNSTSGGVVNGGNDRGGAIRVRGGTLTLTDCTLFGNSAHLGGALSNEGTATLINCTVSGNSAAGNSWSAGGGIWGAVTLDNTLVAGNTAPSGPDASGTEKSSSAYNLIGNGTGMSGITNGTNGNQVGTAASPINPLLAALGNYGGPTPTMALLPGSPALAAGSVAVDGGATTDQRGQPRVVNGAIDIGAFESQAGPAFSFSAPASTTAGNAFSITVTALDASGQVNPTFTGTITFASTDPLASLPATYTFTSADQGVHTFIVTLKSAGVQSIGAVEATASPAIVSVAPAAASAFVISGPSSVGSGTAFSITVTAVDAYGNVATGYTGTIHFSDSVGGATLPGNYTFTGSDQGGHTFTGLKLKTKGWQTITVKDTLNSSILGTWTIDVT
jgi:hypothetical protein